MTKVDAADAYLPLKALAAYSGLSVRTLRSYQVHRGRPMPYYRVGGRVLVRRSEFDAWMRAFRVEQSTSVDAIVADVMAGI